MRHKVNIMLFMAVLLFLFLPVRVRALEPEQKPAAPSYEQLASLSKGSSAIFVEVDCTTDSGDLNHNSLSGALINNEIIENYSLSKVTWSETRQKWYCDVVIDIDPYVDLYEMRFGIHEPVSRQPQSVSVRLWYTGSESDAWKTKNGRLKHIVKIQVVDVMDQEISYKTTEVTKHINGTDSDGFINPLTRTKVKGRITYKSSNTDVAVVDRLTGKVTIEGAGIATIIAVAEETRYYNEASAEYTLIVTPHEYEDKVKAPTHTDGGYTFHRCKICGDSYVDSYEKPLGHEFSSIWKTDESSHWHECSCGEVSGKAPHTEDEGTVLKKPTKLTPGLKVYRCQVCGCIMHTQTIHKISLEGDQNPGREMILWYSFHS